MLGLRVTSRHKRSKSTQKSMKGFGPFGLKLKSDLQSFNRGFPDKKRVDEDGLGPSSEALHDSKMYLKDCEKIKKKRFHEAEKHSSLKQEILQLEARLQAQFEVRHALEKALSYRSSLRAASTEESSVTKPATELVREIAVLELEVVYLEQHLLTLYRKTLDERKNSPMATPRERCSQAFQPDSSPRTMYLSPQVNLRSHSSLSQCSTKISPAQESSVKALRACHSQPLSMTEYAQSTPSLISLAEHLGTRISDHVQETPNRLAEDMVRCMSAVYCKLADPPGSSPSSSVSSVSGFSLRDIWSPGFRNNSSFDVKSDHNPFHEFSGPYSAMLEVSWIYRDNQKLGGVDHLLQDYKSLISRLEEVNPRKLSREEKVAFWINVHNALVMHAFLAIGIPQNNMKRVFLLLKAAYNVGGMTVSADAIRSSILGCRSSRHGHWVRFLISSKTKFKNGDEGGIYGVENQEPLSHFGLCSGRHSDPAVRVYTAKRVFQELEAAKEEYIRAAFGVRKDKKILLPKIVESFARDSGLCEEGVMEMIVESLPESLRRSLKKHCGVGKWNKKKKVIEWAPHDLRFRYLICRELVK